MRNPKQIVAIGGGGFSTTKFDRALCAFILRLAGKRKPRVCYVATAAGDAKTYIAAFYRAAKKLGARPSHLSLYDQPGEPLASFLSRHDVIYVCGGNTRNLLVLWKAWGVDEAMRKAYARGVVLAGHSAGALCWFSGGVTDSFPGRYAPLRCLGFVRGSFCPHYNSEPKRRPIYRRLVGSGALPAGWAADDNVGLHFIDGRLRAVVSSKRSRRAHRLGRRNHVLVETELKPEVLDRRGLDLA